MELCSGCGESAETAMQAAAQRFLEVTSVLGSLLSSGNLAIGSSEPWERNYFVEEVDTSPSIAELEQSEPRRHEYHTDGRPDCVPVGRNKWERRIRARNNRSASC